MEMVMQGFKTLCSLSSIQGAIDGAQYYISKLDKAFVKIIFTTKQEATLLFVKQL